MGLGFAVHHLDVFGEEPFGEKRLSAVFANMVRSIGMNAGVVAIEVDFCKRLVVAISAGKVALVVVPFHMDACIFS